MAIFACETIVHVHVWKTSLVDDTHVQSFTCLWVSQNSSVIMLWLKENMSLIFIYVMKGIFVVFKLSVLDFQLWLGMGVHKKDNSCDVKVNKTGIYGHV